MTTTVINRRTAVIDFWCRIDHEARLRAIRDRRRRVGALAEENTHRNPRNWVESRKVLAKIWNSNIKSTKQPGQRAKYGLQHSISSIKMTLDRHFQPPWTTWGGWMGAMCCDCTTSGKLATIVTQEGNSLIEGTIEKPPVERDMDMAEAGEGSGVAVQRLGKTMRVSFAAASEDWKNNTNGKRLRNETSEPVSAPGDW